MLEELPRDQAMSSAVGGDYDLIGKVEVDLFIEHGLKPNHSIVDLGCGRI